MEIESFKTLELYYSNYNANEMYRNKLRAVILCRFCQFICKFVRTLGEIVKLHKSIIFLPNIYSSQFIIL